MQRFDLGIVGGGPAGAALAWLLAKEAWRVLLVDDGGARTAAPRETLLAAARPGLERAGLWQFAAAAGRRDPCQHGVIWGSDQVVWREDPEPGLLLDRAVFAAGLQAEAAAAGAVLLAGARVRSLGGDDHPAEIIDAEGHCRAALCDRWVVATGRRPRPDLLPLQERVRGPATAALTVVGHSAQDADCALIEAVPQGWWWWIGDHLGNGAATLLCDAEELAAEGSRCLLAAATDAARGPAARLRSGRLAHATRATARVLTTPADALLVGDAAATIDPLASQGVEKALAAADHAAAVLRTARQHPEWWPLLRAQHAQWEHGLFTAHAATAQSFMATEPRFVAARFWQQRIVPVREIAPPVGPLQVCAAVTEATVLVRRDEQFALAPGAVHRDHGTSLTHIGYVPIMPVLHAFTPPCSLADAVAAAGRNARLFVLPPRAIHAAALALYERGWLVRADTVKPAAADNR